MLKFFGSILLWLLRIVLKSIAFAVVILFLVLLSGNFWLPKATEVVFGHLSGFRTVIGRSEGSLFRGRVDFKNFKIKNPKGTFKSENFAVFNRVVADFNMWNLLGKEIVIEEMVIDIADVTAVKNIDRVDNYVLFGENLKLKAQNLAPATNGAAKPVAANQDASLKNGTKKRSLLVKSLTISLGTVHTVDEMTGMAKEYKISYSKEFTNVTNFSKLGRQLATDLGKFGLGFVADSIISSVITLPESAVGGVIKLKDVSVGAVNGLGNAAGNVGSSVGSGVKAIFGGEKK
ncbi:MAG: hypothetical protein LBI61_01590 [Puniceicoccales bacterium]|jgi:hypothetical protein|nr:hypothetical protein [Puniceicoccales bacterium]